MVTVLVVGPLVAIIAVLTIHLLVVVLITHPTLCYRRSERRANEVRNAPSIEAGAGLNKGTSMVRRRGYLGKVLNFERTEKLVAPCGNSLMTERELELIRAEARRYVEEWDREY